jgi:hypothetical protein
MICPRARRRRLSCSSHRATRLVSRIHSSSALTACAPASSRPICSLENFTSPWWTCGWLAAASGSINSSGQFAHHCSKDVITFKCQTTAYCNRYTAWTHSFWLSTIRLCKNDNSGFFKADGSFGAKLEMLGSVIVHEVAHNINAIGDKKINGTKMYSETEVQQLAKRKPGVASWNAANYDEYARSR